MRVVFVLALLAGLAHALCDRQPAAGDFRPFRSEPLAGVGEAAWLADNCSETVALWTMGADDDAALASPWPRVGCPFARADLEPFEMLFPAPRDEDAIVITTPVLLSCSPGVLFARITVAAGGVLVVNDRNVTLRVRDLRVSEGGQLLVGAEQCRMYSAIDIELVSDAVLSRPQGAPSKGIQSGGVVEMHGKRYHPTWTRLARPARAGDALVALADAVNWEVGQEVLLVTTADTDCAPEFAAQYCGGASHQNEVRRIVAVDRSRRALLLDAPLAYTHEASPAFQGEVALLSRRVRLLGSQSGDGFGGHVLIWGGQARFSGVQGDYMGQVNQLGRYPFHFHTLGEAPHSYVQECSVTHSNFRAFVLHGTNSSRVERNVAYDVRGMAVYLEDGVEEKNTLAYNLVAHVHPVLAPASAGSDVTESYLRIVPHDAAASPFLVSNAFNIFRGNAASGGWSSFALLNFKTPLGLSRGPDFANANPWRRPALEFRGNTAHSSGFYASSVAGCMYQSGWVRHNATNYVVFSVGPEDRVTLDAATGAPIPMVWRDTKLWRCSRAIVYSSSGQLDLIGLEVHQSRDALATTGRGRTTISNGLITVNDVAPSSAAGPRVAVDDTRSAASTTQLLGVTLRGYRAPLDVALRSTDPAGVWEALRIEGCLPGAVSVAAPFVPATNRPNATRNTCALPYDLNGDGLVDTADARLFPWGPAHGPSAALDCNGDGLLDVRDLACLLDAYAAP